MISERAGLSSEISTTALVIGTGSYPEPYLILRLKDGQTLRQPLATYESLSEWPLRSTVRFFSRIEPPVHQAPSTTTIPT